ncbi:MAG: acetylxylan esterase [Phycisphaeraceae bacterium]|nr:acetylxylan esterase [Phycisphaeraceae bacterium]
MFTFATPLRLRLIPLLVLLCTSLAIAAPKVEVKITTDRSDGVYKQGQPITFNVYATRDGKPMTDTVTYTVSKDGARTLGQGEIDLGKQPAVITASLDEPGFVKLFVNVPGHLDYKNREKPAVAGAAVDPELIKPSMPEPTDFDAFWESKKKLVLASPMKPVLTPVECKRDDVLAFDLQLNCPDGQGNPGGAPVSGYFAMPKNAQKGKCPAILFPHSAGVKTSYMNNPVDRGAAVGMIGLDFNAHGLPNGQSKSYYSKLYKGDLSDYRVRGREDRETYYFLGMYMRLYRALQYLKSRPEWDGKTLIVWGSSQGGGQTLVAGGLDEDITLLLAGVPAMCDHGAIAIGRKPGWPGLFKSLDREKDKTTWANVLKTSGYFDAINFARRIKAPIIMSVGFCDVTCAPTSVYAAYNVIGSDKQIYHGLDMPHRQNSDVWNLFKGAAFEHAKQALSANQ